MPPSHKEITRRRSSFIQFHGPVSLAEELGPAFNSHIVPSVEWFPRRSNRHFPKRHVCFSRRTVGLSFVACQASQNAIFPCTGSTSRSRLDVIQRQFFASRLHTAILTSEPISLVDVSSTECHHVRWNPVIRGQCDHFRYSNPKRHRLDEGFILLWNLLRPIGPGVLLEVGRIDDPRTLCSYEPQRACHGGYAQWLPIPV